MDSITAAEIARVIDLPEVEVLAKRLAEYGLGICVPHMHDSNDSPVPLTPGTVQFEEELRVSFRSDEDPRVRGALPVSWVWNDGLKVVGRCRQGHG